MSLRMALDKSSIALWDTDSSSDCTNDLSVLSRIRPADPRFSEERIGYDLVAVMALLLGV